MEEKRFDRNSIIGFVLIFVILIFIMYQNQPDPKVLAAQKAEKELVVKAAKAKELEAKKIELATVAVAATGDSTQLAQLQNAGLIASGVNPDTGLVEIVEIENHPFFIGVQYHPEYKSTVANPHPIFVSFVAAAVQAKKK